MGFADFEITVLGDVSSPEQQLELCSVRSREQYSFQMHLKGLCMKGSQV